MEGGLQTVSVGMDMSCGWWIVSSVCWYGHELWRVDGKQVSVGMDMSCGGWMANSVYWYGHELWRVDGKQCLLVWT